MNKNKHSDKFRVKADLALFQAIQKNGRLSEERIAKTTNIPSTTVHYAMKRIKKRDFFDIRAVPRLERFQEIPMAVIGFSNVHPLKIKELQRDYAGAEVVQFFHSEKDAVLVVMDVRMASLTEKLFDIMERVGEKPCIYITSPTIAKCYSSIPDHVLEGVYAGLPGRMGSIRL